MSRKALKSGWLQHLAPTLSDAIVDSGRLLYFDDGEVIYGFREEQNHIYGVANGKVKMVLTMNEQAPYLGHIVGRGYWFGDLDVIPGTTALMKNIAYGPTTLCAVSRDAINKLADESQDVWRAIALLAGFGASTAIGIADDLTLRDPEQKIAAILLRLCSRRNAFQGTPPFSTIPITQAELANVSGMSKSLVERVLAAFSRAGTLNREYGKIRLLDPSALERALAL